MDLPVRHAGERGPAAGRRPKGRADTGEPPAKALPFGQWSTPERLRFFNSLPQSLPHARLAELDKAFGLSAVGNSEVLFAWLKLGINSRYPPALPVAERFLLAQGRRKFVEPLFRAMVEQGAWGRPAAERIYAKARPTYHPVTSGSVDKLLGR